MRLTMKPSFETIAKDGNQILTVQYLNDYLNDAEEIHARAHIHTYTEILWILKGSGKLHVDLEVFELATGQMYFIRPGEVHSLHCGPDTSGYVLTLSGKASGNAPIEIVTAFNSEFLSLIPHQKQMDISPCYLDDIKDILERMMKETFHRRVHSNEILFRYFNIFLFFLRKQPGETESQIIQNRNMQVCEQFKELVNTHYKSKKMVSDYASELNLTPNYLNEIIKKITGHSAGYLIRQRIALEAKRYAMHSGVCMKEIGYSLGFSDMAHFSKFFKSVVGSNFTEFKNSKRQFSMSL